MHFLNNRIELGEKPKLWDVYIGPTPDVADWDEIDVRRFDRSQYALTLTLAALLCVYSP